MSAQNATSSQAAIDVHAHAFLPDVYELVSAHPLLREAERLDRRRFGNESSTVNTQMISERLPLMTNLDARVESMREAGTTAQVLSVAPTQYYGWADRGLAWDLAQATNEGIASLRDQRPELFTGFGVIPQQHPEDAAAALDHAVKTCDLQGVEISSFGTGRDVEIELSDRRFDEFWHTAEQSGSVVFIHPWGCTLDGRLNSWYMSNSIGQPVEHAVALGHLVFGGVLDRFPGVRIIAAHGGGYFPTHLGRADHAWRVRPEVNCAEPPSSYLSKLYFDSLVHHPEELAALVRRAGKNQVLLGSDFPFDMGSMDPLGDLKRAGLSEEANAAILSENAERLGLGPTSALAKPAIIDRNMER